jgi:unsaturated rhamnogalacturonyl hydrolase
MFPADMNREVVDYIEMFGISGGLRDFLIDSLRIQVEGLAKLQEDNGMWHTLLDDKTSYEEASATAGFGYGIFKGIRLGMLDEKYRSVAEKALYAVIERIDEDGILQEVSYGTGMGADLDHYRNIEIGPAAYGQVLAMLLLGEVL